MNFKKPMAGVIAFSAVLAVVLGLGFAATRGGLTQHEFLGEPKLSPGQNIGVGLPQLDYLPAQEWELISRADVNLDNQEESIYLDKSQIGERLVSLHIVDESGRQLWTEQFSTSHAGWGQLFLRELGGKQYLLRYNPGMFQGYCTYTYTLFTLENGKEKVFRTNGIEFDINGTTALDISKMIAFADEANALLGKSILLISSDGGDFHFGPSSAEPFLERFAWLDEYPQLFDKGDDLRVRLNKFSKYAVKTRAGMLIKKGSHTQLWGICPA